MKFHPNRLIIIAVAVIAILVAYKMVQPPSESVDFEVNTSSSQTTSVELTSGLVTMIDLGADECIPCKMMAPILEELEKEYKGRADIIFIDVWKNPDQAKKYRIRAIPTQIFFDADGKEVQRHIGFMDKKRIVEILSKLGVS
ncbi:MAG: thioredoxin family protein [Desulfobacterales bacterium]